MGKLSVITLLVFIYIAKGLAAFAVTTQNEASSRLCSTYCTDSKLIHLTPGTTYEYSYSGWTHTTLGMLGTKPQEHDVTSGLLINATVSVTALSPCEISMTMSNVTLSGDDSTSLSRDELSDNSREALLSRHPVRASLQGGRIETLCVEESENEDQRWALNVKRGVLSALQVGLRTVKDLTGDITMHETDVSGTCRTRYEHVHLEDRGTLITRTKDLSMCSSRQHSRSYLDLATPSSRPLLRGQQECTQLVSDGHVTMVRCSERHVFQPFSSQGQGAVTKVEQTLVKENEYPGKVQKPPALPASHRRTSLLYELGDSSSLVAPSDESQKVAAMNEAVFLLRDLVLDNKGVERDTARKFSTLVRSMRKLSKEQLIAMVTGPMRLEVAREYLLSALPTLDTVAAAEVMTSLYLDTGDQSQRLRTWLEKNAVTWFSSLVSSRQADMNMLTAVQPLLWEFDHNTLPSKDVSSIVLGVTGLTRALCQRSLQPCHLDDRVIKVMQVLSRVAGPACSGLDPRRVIIALKGLGNTGLVTAKDEWVQECIKNTSLGTEVRLAAMDTFRRAPCSELSDRSSSSAALLTVYAQETEDPEVRIAAYLALVRCPTPALVRVLKKSLHSETVNQVGSFVWTHLTNSQESSSKARQPLRALLSNHLLQNKFRTDARQFSRNYEISHYFETLGSGFTSDANVIFSPKSYVPRSAMLNFTIDLFGESVNVFEIGGRVEGFEPIIENLFSKNGAFENEAVEGFLKNVRVDSTHDDVLNLTRTLKQPIKPKASSYFRLFGNEISYQELSDILDNASNFDVNPWNLLKILNDRKEHEISRSLELIDIIHEVPTAIGLPLKLSLNGTAILKLTLKGYFDLVQTGVQMSGKFVPSANVAITGTMAVGDKDFIQGLKLETSMFTHTNMDNRLKISFDGKMNFQSEMPDEKQTVIELTSERFIFTGDKIKSIPDLMENRETYTDCTGEYANKFLGVQICSDISYVNGSLDEFGPYFPLTGDAFYNLSIIKTDPTFKTYDFSTSWTVVPGLKYDLGVSYDRLGSSLENRRRVVQAVYDKHGGIARLTLDLPEKQTEIALSWDSKELSAAELLVTWDRSSVAEFLAKLPHQRKLIPGTNLVSGKIQPHIRVKINGWPEFAVEGAVNYMEGTKYSAELEITGLYPERKVHLAGDYNTDGSGLMEGRLAVDSPKVSWDIRASAKLTSNSLGARFNGHYNLTMDEQHRLELVTKYFWTTQGILRRDHLHMGLQASQWPWLSGQLTADMQRSSGYYESSARLLMGSHEWNMTQRAQSSGGSDVWLSQTLTCPSRGVAFLAEHRHKLKENGFSTTTKLHVDELRDVLFHLDWLHIPGDGVTFSTEATVLWPGVTFASGKGPFFESRIRQVLPGKYDAHLITQWTMNRNPLILNVTYADLSTLKAVNHTLEAELTGIFGYTSNRSLGLRGGLHAASGSAHASLVVLEGAEQKGRVGAVYQLEQQERRKARLDLTLGRKNYALAATVVNTDLEMSLLLDLMISRHMAFDFKVLRGSSISSSIFLDKERSPESNLTINMEILQMNGHGYNLNILYPGQHITMVLQLSPSVTMHRQVVILSGHEAQALISWQPNSEVKLLASLVGSPSDAVVATLEAHTQGLPAALGPTKRKIAFNYAPHKRSTPAEIAVTYSWSKANSSRDEEVNMQLTIRPNSKKFMVGLRAGSTLWNDRQFKARLVYNHLGTVSNSGELSCSWADRGAEITWNWDIRSHVLASIKSSWETIPSCGLEVMYAKRSPNLQWSTKIHYREQAIEAILKSRREEDKSTRSATYQLDVTTPFSGYEFHSTNVSVSKSLVRQYLILRLDTPLVGDYTFNYTGLINDDIEILEEAIVHILSADTTLIKINAILQLNSRPAKKVEVNLLIPDICNSKSTLLVESKDTGFKMNFDFSNNKKLLHEFGIMYEHQHFNNNSVLCNVGFYGYSYLILTSRWDVELKHSGTRKVHQTYVKINNLILDHDFEFTDNGDWNFRLIGKTSLDILNVTLVHSDWKKLNYFVKIQGTDVLEVRGDLEQGYGALFIMDEVFQIHTKFTNDDELITNSKIISDSKIVANVFTSSYFRLDDEGNLESLIFNGDIKSNSDSLSLQINMDSFAQIASNFKLYYAEHHINANLNLSNRNNSINFVYMISREKIMSLESSISFGEATCNSDVLASYKEMSMKISGNFSIDEENTISALLQADTNIFGKDVFPLSLSAKISLPDKMAAISILDAKNFGATIAGQLGLNPDSKSVELKVTTSGFDDNFYYLSGEYISINGQSLNLAYEEKLFKYDGKFHINDHMIEAKIKTPNEGYENMSLRLGFISDLPKRAVLEIVKNKYRFESEMILSGEMHRDAKVIVVAKSTEGLDLEGLFSKEITDRSSDCGVTVILNGEKVEAGALLVYVAGSLDIQTNVTRGGETSYMNSSITFTPTTKSFSLSCEHANKRYSLDISSASGGEDDFLSHKSFKVQTPSFTSEFKYEKSSNLSLAFIKFQNQILQCSLIGDVKKGNLAISQISDQSVSNVELLFDFYDKIDATLMSSLNVPFKVNLPLTLSSAEPLYIKTLYHPQAGKVHFNFNHKDVNYLADGSYKHEDEHVKIDLALETPFFEKTCINTTYNFEKPLKTLSLHFDYGVDFFEMVSQFSFHGNAGGQLEFDMKSSIVELEKMKITGNFKLNDEFIASLKFLLPLKHFIFNVHYIPSTSFVGKLQTIAEEYEIQYSVNKNTYTVALHINGKDIVKTILIMENNSLRGTLIMPNGPSNHRNVTVYVGLGSDMPSKSVEVHHNDNLVFKAYMYPVDSAELQSGTGIMATFYQGKEKLIYDAQFSVNNPVYVILKQHKTINGTRDILHFSLNVTDEHTATGEAIILLPIAPNTKVYARGHIQIENNNAEFKVSYKIDGETESNFSINYHTFVDNYSMYNIVTNIYTPFQGYENISLKMQSSLTETVVNFISPFSGYENIRIVSVHRLKGNVKELQVQYQNMNKRLFYVKALFKNERDNKKIDLEARSPFLNGQALVYSNVTHMGVKLEQDHIILCEIMSNLEAINNGFKYEFAFTKPDKTFNLHTHFIKERSTELKFLVTVDKNALIDIDFLVNYFGHISATLSMPNKVMYVLSGDVDVKENSLQISINGQNFKTELSFAVKQSGYLKIVSSLISEQFEMSWNNSRNGITFNLNAGPNHIIKFISSDTGIEIEASLKKQLYSFIFGQVSSKGWPNIKVALIWDSKSLIDFQHNYLTDSHHLTLVKTRLTSPYLGTHSTMKFDFTLKTDNILSVDAEFKWRPQDLTTFKSQLKLDKFNSLAKVEFRYPQSPVFVFTALYDFTNAVKNIEVLYQLNEKIQLLASIVPTGTEQKLNITFESPLEDYKLVTLIGSHSFKYKSQNANLIFTRGSTVSDIYIAIDGKELKVKLSSGNTRWLLTGRYELDEGLHKIESVLQYGGVDEFIKIVMGYKPNKKFEVMLDGLYVLHIDYEQEWNKEKKSLDITINQNAVISKLNFHLTSRDKFHMLASSLQSPYFDFLRATAILDAESQELKGAIQLNETVYSMHATQKNASQYSIALMNSDIEQIHFDVSFDGEVSTGLNVEVLCQTPDETKLKLNGLIKLSSSQQAASIDIFWNRRLDESMSLSYETQIDHGVTSLVLQFNSEKLRDVEINIVYSPKYVEFGLRNKSETFNGHIDYKLGNAFSINATVDFNQQMYGVTSYYEPNEVVFNLGFKWPMNQRLDFLMTLRPGDLDISLATPFIHFSNIQVAGKYSEYMTSNIYQLTSSGKAKWGENAIALEGNLKNSLENYGLSGSLKWGDENTIKLSSNVLHSRTLIFGLETPFKGLPYLSAKFEALKYRHMITGIRGSINTPFSSMPQVNFTFERVNNLVEVQFSFETAAYKNISLHTKFSTLTYSYLYLHAKVPFLNSVKNIILDAKSDESSRTKRCDTKITLQLDESIYEVKNNYTVIDSKLESYVYMKGPRSEPIEFTFGGKFIMNSFTNFDVETYVDENLVAVKCVLTRNAIMAGKINLPALTTVKIPKSEFDFTTVVRKGYFEGNLNYNYGGLIGHSSLKNKLTDDSLDSVMYLNLPRILQYPLRLELNANYVSPRLQFSGYASFMAEHRLDLTMSQNSFRTTLDAHLNSAFLKGTRKFSLALTSDTLSMSLNDEIRVTGQKKPNQLILTLSQLLKKQDHTITYNWELMKVPKFEVILESPILNSQKAIFSATYVGLTQDVNLKLVSGTESLHLDYGVSKTKNSKGVKIVIGNEQTQLINFAANMIEIPNGHEFLADLQLVELNYKAKINYTLPNENSNTLLTTAFKFETPYLFPMKVITGDLKVGRQETYYVLATSLNLDEEKVSVKSELHNDSLTLQYATTFDYLLSGSFVSQYTKIDEKNIINVKMITNGIELLSANASLLKRHHSLFLECNSKANIQGFEEFHVKLTIPSELKYSLIANVELMSSSDPFKAYFILTSRPQYTNVDLVMTGMSANIHLTSNQGDFSYKSGKDNYHMRIYSKSAGPELHSELTVNSGSTELFKVGLFGMYHNYTDFYILMSSTSVFEPIQNVVFNIGAEKSQIRFGAEYEGTISPSRQFYTAIIKHHAASLVDFDLGLSVENSNSEIFMAKITHTLKSDFYVALAQINNSIFKITKINQDGTTLATCTAKHFDFHAEMSGKLILHSNCKGVDVKLTHGKMTYQIGGLYNTSEDFFKTSFDIDSPYTSQNSFIFEFTRSETLFISIVRNHSSVITIDFSPLKSRTEYILVNLPVAKFMYVKSNPANSSLEIKSTLSVRETTYEYFLSFDQDPSNTDSYKINSTIIYPGRTVELFTERVKTESRNANQLYISWEVQHKRLGYMFDSFKDKFMKNIKIGIEIPSRAVEFKTHSKHLIVDELTEIEYGVQFNWDTKVHTTPVTFVTSLKQSQNVGYMYVVLGHPSFDGTLALDAELRRPHSNETHVSMQMGTVTEGHMSPIVSTTVQIINGPMSMSCKILLVHPETNLNQAWNLRADWTDGLFTKVSLSDVTKNRHATGVISYVIASNRLDVNVACEELELRLGGQLDLDRSHGRYGLMLSGSYDALTPPVTASANYERLDSDHIILSADLSISPDRSYLAHARYSPRDISAVVTHLEYGDATNSIQASITLNTSESLSVIGRYHPEIWSNLTLDLAVPAENAAIVAQELNSRLRSLLREEITQRFSNMSSSRDLSVTYRKIIEHTKTQWVGIRQELSMVRSLFVQMYNKNDFFVRSAWEFSLTVMSHGRQLMSSGLSKTQQALKLLFYQVIPNVMNQIYNATVEPLVEGFKKLAPGVARAVRKVAEMWRKLQVSVANTLRKTVMYAKDSAVATVRAITERLSLTADWLIETCNLIATQLIDPWLTSLSELAFNLESWLSEVTDKLMNLPSQIEEYFMSLEETQELMKLYKNYATWLEELHFAEFVTSLRDALRSWYMGLMEDLVEQLGEPMKYVVMAIQTMKGSYEEVLSLPPVVYIRMVYSRVYSKVIWLFNYWQVQSNYEHLIIRVSDFIISTVVDMSDDSLEQISYAHSSSSYLDSISDDFHYDPTTGDFRGVVDLPFTWERFDQTPKLNQNLKEKFYNFRHSVMDRTYEVLAQSNGLKDALYRTFLPPFTANTVITSSGHIITFDDHHFRIKEALCGKYLLAADYRDNQFSVIVNYGSSDLNSAGPLQSLTFYTKEGHSVDVALDYGARDRGDEDGFSKVTVDGTKMELPAGVGAMQVTREGQLVLVKWSRSGSSSDVTMRCNVVAGLCSLEVSGWFHGRVTGLAGSMDSEPGNDFQQADIKDVMKQWKLGEKASPCSPSSTKSKSVGNDLRVPEVCIGLFSGRNSPLQTCFSRLDPTPFMEMCKQDVVNSRANHLSGPSAQDLERGAECLAAEAYMEQCRFAGMDISMPANCVKCRLPNGRNLISGEAVVYDSAPGSRLPPPPALADVVFLLERPPVTTETNSCLTGQDLADLPAKLDGVFRSLLNISNTRFALLSYGGGLAPSLHTLEGHVWSSRRGMQQALTTLQLTPALMPTSSSELLPALFATARLSFRAGTSKSVILVSCQACGQKQDASAIFAEASSLLLEADLRLHVIQSDPVTFRRTAKRPSVHQGRLHPVIGVDAQGAYTGRRVKGTSIPLPSKAIMRQLALPKDVCTPLSLETNGTLFSATRLLNNGQEPQRGTIDAKRKWMDVWSRRVASSARPSPCQTCDCLAFPDGSSRVTCQPCVSPAIQHFLQEWEDFLEAEMEEGEGDDEEGLLESGETQETMGTVPLGLMGNSRVKEDLESERVALNRLREMLTQGKSMQDLIL